MTFENVCEVLGVPWDPRGVAGSTFPWNGEVMNGLVREGCPQCSDHLWHELAHWLCAEPIFRVYAGFGWGSGPDSAPLVDGVEEEEEAASALGIWLQASLGDDTTPRIEDHAKDHSWDEAQLQEFWAGRKDVPCLIRAFAILDAAGIVLHNFNGWS